MGGADSFVTRSKTVALIAAIGWTLAATHPASAVTVQIDWSANMTGAQGPGSASGTFGTFEVSPDAITDLVLLPVSQYQFSLNFDSFTGNGTYVFNNSTGVPTLRVYNASTASLFGAGSSIQSQNTIQGNGCTDVCRFGLISDNPSYSNASFQDQGGGAAMSSGPAYFTVTVVPEPSTALLLGAGFLGLAKLRSRR